MSAAVPIDDSLRQRVLAPYAPNARYVHRAALTQADDGSPPRPDVPASWLRLDGDCGFDAPCYIAATGHFNAVECNITYNQMLYLGLAEVVRRGLLAELRHWTLDEFFRRQLPDVLIADYRVHFRRPIHSAAYRAWFVITGVLPKPHRDLLLLTTRAGCGDDGGGECELDATIALVRWRPA